MLQDVVAALFFTVALTACASDVRTDPEGRGDGDASGAGGRGATTTAEASGAASGTSGATTVTSSGAGGGDTPPARLFVTSQGDHSVKVYDEHGDLVRSIGGFVDDPIDAMVGTDGVLLVTDARADLIRRFSLETGFELSPLAEPTAPEGMDVADGVVYVGGISAATVRSFDATTGEDRGDFGGSISDDRRDVKVRNGRLYVALWNARTVEVFDLATRASLGYLFPPNEQGLPIALAFGPDGALYVGYFDYVDRYDPETGAALGRFIDTPGDGNIGIAWGPDGSFYVAASSLATVRRYDGNGTRIGDFVPPGEGGLEGPFHIAFGPPGP